jgi:hypothetical protein
MWKEVSEARYDEALGVLSPAIWLGKGFLMGEPHDHRPCTVTNKIGPTYAAFIQALGRYYEGDPMTILSRIFFSRDPVTAPWTSAILLKAVIDWI